MTGEKNFLEWYEYLIIAYAVMINIAAAAVTVRDKKAARTRQWRVPEKTLLLLAALSGCVTMYVTMRIIHHKTRHKVFVIGIPVIFVCEIFAALGIYAVSTGKL